MAREKGSTLSALNVITRFINIATSDGKTKLKYAIQQAFYIAFAVLFTFFIIKIFNSIGNLEFGAAILLIVLAIALIVATIEFALFGVIGQIVLLITAIIHLCGKHDVKLNVISLIIAILSCVGLAVAIILLL